MKEGRPKQRWKGDPVRREGVDRTRDYQPANDHRLGRRAREYFQPASRRGLAHSNGVGLKTLR
jgi:hypothetical protein